MFERLISYEYDFDNYLDLFKMDIDGLKKGCWMHIDGIGFTTNIMNGESTTSYTNGDAEEFLNMYLKIIGRTLLQII